MTKTLSGILIIAALITSSMATTVSAKACAPGEMGPCQKIEKYP